MKRGIVHRWVSLWRRSMGACLQQLRQGQNRVGGWGEQVPAMYFTGWQL